MRHWQAAQELLLWKCWVCAQSQWCNAVPWLADTWNLFITMTISKSLLYKMDQSILHWSVCLRSTFVTPSNEHSHTSCNLHCKRLCKMLTHLTCLHERPQVENNSRFNLLFRNIGYKEMGRFHIYIYWYWITPMEKFTEVRQNMGFARTIFPRCTNERRICNMGTRAHHSG